MKKKFSVVGAIVAGAFLACAAQSVLADEAVDAGQKLYQREGCQTCHGGKGEGSAAFPSLVTSAKAKDKAAFTAIVMEGKSPMPGFKGYAKVVAGIDNLFAFVNSLSAGK